MSYYYLLRISCFLFLLMFLSALFFFFFFNDTATTEIYTLSLHDALPILLVPSFEGSLEGWRASFSWHSDFWRSEEHTSELQSPDHLVCRLLLEKKKRTHVLVNRTRICIERRRRLLCVPKILAVRPPRLVV